MDHNTSIGDSAVPSAENVSDNERSEAGSVTEEALQSTSKADGRATFNLTQLLENLFVLGMSTYDSWESTIDCYQKSMLGFSKLTPYALQPERGSKYAAGYDLKSAYDTIVPKNGKQLVKTDLTLNLPNNCYGRIAPRSGLAWKHFIDVGAGVIDRDFTGNICVLLFNHSDKDFIVKRGDRIAQLICEKIVYPDLYEYSGVGKTERGSKGFGSTGLQ